MQALYGKPSVDHAFNINDRVPVTDKAKATSLPDILLVDFNPCEVSQSSMALPYFQLSETNDIYILQFAGRRFPTGNFQDVMMPYFKVIH